VDLEILVGLTTDVKCSLKRSFSCLLVSPIVGFHCHTIIKTIRQIKSRIKAGEDPGF